MCSVDCTTLGVALCNNLFYPIYHAKKILNCAQHNFTMTDHELPVVEYKFENFIRFVLLFHEFYFDVKDRRWCENRVADHLSRFEVKITYELEVKINDVFPDVQVFMVILQQIP